MSFATKHNTASTKFNYDIPETHEFAKPSELVEANGLNKVYTVRSMYINKKGKFGKEPVIITDECLLNAPSHLVEVVENAMADESDVQLVNNGKVGFKIYPYKNDYGEQYGLEWVDIK